MRELIFFFSLIILIGGCGISCKKDKKPSEISIPQSESNYTIKLVNGSNDMQKDFSIDYLNSLPFNGEIFIPNKNVWDIDEYEKYKSYYTLTDDEGRVLGGWVPISEDKDIADIYNYQHFGFWPNKICAVGFGPGYAIGLWEIQNGWLVINIYGYNYPDGHNYVQERCNPYSTNLCRIEDISPVGYSRRKFAYVPISEKLVNKFTNSITTKQAYYYKSLASFDPSVGIFYAFMDRIEKILKAGNPSAMDIVTLKDPKYAELW